MKKIIKRTSYGVFLVLFLMGSGELLCRTLFKHRLGLGHRSLCYLYDPVLGWFPEKEKSRIHTGYRQTEVYHNYRGLRDNDVSIAKNKPRILFLGDSFVWGFDVEKHERFTEKLRKRMKSFEIINMGVAGYSNDQEYLLLKREFSTYQPDVVFLVICGNDYVGNMTNYTHETFKPYFVYKNEALKVQGTPVPKGNVDYIRAVTSDVIESYFVRLLLRIFKHIRLRTIGIPEKIEVPDITHELILAMKTFVERGGAQFLVAFVDKTDQDHALQAYLQKLHVPFLDLSDLSVKEGHRYPSYGYHWTDLGHTIVSNRIYNFSQLYVQ